MLLEEKNNTSEIAELLLRQTKFMTKGRMMTEASINSHAKYGFSRINNDQFNKLLLKAKMCDNHKVTTMKNGREQEKKLKIEVAWLLKQVFCGMSK